MSLLVRKGPYSLKRASFSQSVAFSFRSPAQNLKVPRPLTERDRALLIYPGPVYLKQYGFLEKGSGLSESGLNFKNQSMLKEECLS